MSEVKTIVVHNQDLIARYSTVQQGLSVTQNLVLPVGAHYRVVQVLTEGASYNWNINVAANAYYEHWLLNMSSAPIDYQLTVTLMGKAARTKFRGMILGKAKTKLQHKMRINHDAPESDSDIIVHGVADDQSKITFSGLLYVKEKIIDVVAHMLLKNLLLTNQAEVSAKPELEIYSDQVICTHGANVGDLDEHALFYLQSRGFSKEQAKEVLLKAFTAKFLPELEDADIQAWLEQFILAALKKETL